ncbi:MAG: Gfo/Idh/MocA family protein [Phycisphaeraceae bacterium]
MSAASATDAVGYALIGGGRFGLFACQQHRSLKEVRLRAVADIDPHAARRTAASLGVEAAGTVDDVLARDDVQLVYIAAPPWTHRELTEKALNAGKHVLCEKPLAVTLEEARAMIELAQQRGRLLVANLLMRYNPLCEAVRQLIDQRSFGEPLHGFFENYAKDEILPPDHWFWDPQKSGGIFVEHGVHFFDLFQWWLGEAQLESAQAVRRPGAEFIEQVQATWRYETGALVNFYHGFTQAERMDRQEMRLLFERGTVQLFEWVPTMVEVDALLDDHALAALQELLPHAVVEPVASYRGEERRVTSRHKTYQVDGRYRIRADSGMSKDELYGHVVRGLLADQVAALRDPAHVRRVTERNGYDALAQAVQAQRLAEANVQ